MDLNKALDCHVLLYADNSPCPKPIDFDGIEGQDMMLLCFILFVVQVDLRCVSLFRRLLADKRCVDG